MTEPEETEDTWAQAYFRFEHIPPIFNPQHPSAAVQCTVPNRCEAKVNIRARLYINYAYANLVIIG